MALEELVVSAEALCSFFGACVEEGEGWGAAKGTQRPRAVTDGAVCRAKSTAGSHGLKAVEGGESPSESMACTSRVTDGFQAQGGELSTRISRFARCI